MIIIVCYCDFDLLLGGNLIFEVISQVIYLSILFFNF